MVTSYVYDEKNRVVQTVVVSEWTPEDRALMLAYDAYVKGLCRGCGHPKATAWHYDNDGFFEATETYVCHACTAARPANEDGTVKPVEYDIITDTRDYVAKPLPPFQQQRTTDDVEGGG